MKEYYEFQKKCDLINPINPLIKSGVYKFFTEFFHWVDDEIISSEVKYFKSKEELADHLIQNESFGTYHFDEDVNYYENENGEEEAEEEQKEEEEAEEEEEYRKAKNIKTWANDEDVIEWTGEGYYIAWSWSDEHIARIDKVYKDLGYEYLEKSNEYNFIKPSSEEIERLMKELDI